VNIGDIITVAVPRTPLWLPLPPEQMFNSTWIELKLNEFVFFLDSRQLEGFGRLHLTYYKVMTQRGEIGWVWEKNTKSV
jgi:hypothetical protein